MNIPNMNEDNLYSKQIDSLEAERYIHFSISFSAVFFFFNLFRKLAQLKIGHASHTFFKVK